MSELASSGRFSPKLAVEAGVPVTAGVPEWLLGTAVVAAGAEEGPGVPAGVVAAAAGQSLACEQLPNARQGFLQKVWRT